MTSLPSPDYQKSYQFVPDAWNRRDFVNRQPSTTEAGNLHDRGRGDVLLVPSTAEDRHAPDDLRRTRVRELSTKDGPGEDRAPPAGAVAAACHETYAE